MATLNPFDLLGDDAEDPSQLAVSVAPLEKADKTKKAAPGQTQPAKSSAKLPSKPLPPAQAVREARNEGSRGGGRGGGRGYGRGRGGYNRDFSGSDVAGGNNGYVKPSEEGDLARNSERRGGYGGPRGSFRGGRRGGFSNGEAGEERPRRTFERRSGTGRGSEFKREGAGRGNWGTPGEELAAETEEAGVETEKEVIEKPIGEDGAADANKETPAEVEEEKEPEDKEMTLDEYEKILEEKKKALQSLSAVERKVDLKEFESMQQLANKKANYDVFIKLGSEKDKRKDALEKDEKAKKAVSINEFLKPADGESYYPRGGRGRGRGGRGRGGGSRGGYGGYQSEAAPAIEDTAQFPTLGGK